MNVVGPVATRTQTKLFVLRRSRPQLIASPTWQGKRDCQLVSLRAGDPDGDGVPKLMVNMTCNGDIHGGVCSAVSIMPIS